MIDILEFAHQEGCKELHMVVDQESGLKGIVAIYSTKLGSALGGCRFLPYRSSVSATVDAIRLAKSMAFKSAIASLPLGGGKAVLMQPLNYDRSKLFKAFGKFLNTLNGRYITAVDSGTSVADMDDIATQTNSVTGTSDFHYTISDPSVATARGILRGILAAVKFKFDQKNLKGMHVTVQGVGNVGYHLVKLLHDFDANITVCDVNAYSIKKLLTKYPYVHVVDPEKIYQVKADIFAPCALGGVLNDYTIPRLKAKIVAGAANNQLVSEHHAEILYQKEILYIPDFVINSGGVIYVAGPLLKQTEIENLQKIDNIYNTVLNILSQHVAQKMNTYKIAYNMAVKKLNDE